MAQDDRRPGLTTRLRSVVPRRRSAVRLPVSPRTCILCGRGGQRANIAWLGHTCEMLLRRADIRRSALGAEARELERGTCVLGYEFDEFLRECGSHEFAWSECEQ